MSVARALCHPGQSARGIAGRARSSDIIVDDAYQEILREE
jgi:hypothetical protein